ncbi:MAG: penicillin-binding protein 2 [Betaproteobacteria bacterium]|nr:penicillin-binding protein 2 [Betaproteobacteria bacterium]
MRTFNEPDENVGRFYIRLLAAVLFVLFGCALLALRLYSLQVKSYSHYLDLAEGNRISMLPIVPQRGNIVDRNGAMLARNFVAYTLEITPAQVVNLDKTIDALSEFIAIEPKDRQRFHNFLRDNRRLDSAPIRTRLSDEEVARFMGQRYRFTGVDVQARLFRDYPNGALGSHLIGYISRISDRDTEEIEARGETANYRGSLYIGKSGVESTYQVDLHGITGLEHVENTAGGKVVRSLKSEPATPGNDIELSVDVELQRVAETAFGERRGALVAIDPSTGDVLALVSMPTFDPNLFVDGIPAQDWRMLNTSENKPLLNRAVSSTYPPGSTFKPFMALAGLHSGKRTLTYKMNDSGGFAFGGHYFKDHKKGGHGVVDMHKSIVVSCNTFYYVLANDMGIDAMSSFISHFGLGSRTGIDIPDEKEGVLPSAAWKRRHFARLGPQHQKWYAGETISVGIGQGYNAYTPLQMASATAMIANDGKRMRPRVLRAVIDGQGQRQELPPEFVAELPSTPEHITAVQRAMEDVTRPGGGTAARSFMGASYRAAGKTGTAQVIALAPQKGKQIDKNDETLRDHSWFIAYAPADAPKIAVAVFVENGGPGSVSAAPIARQVFDAYLLKKTVDKPTPEDTGAEPEDDPRDHLGHGAPARREGGA